jgi:hypothetical protein
VSCDDGHQITPLIQGRYRGTEGREAGAGGLGHASEAQVSMHWERAMALV